MGVGLSASGKPTTVTPWSMTWLPWPRTSPAPRRGAWPAVMTSSPPPVLARRLPAVLGVVGASGYAVGFHPAVVCRGRSRPGRGSGQACRRRAGGVGDPAAVVPGRGSALHIGPNGLVEHLLRSGSAGLPDGRGVRRTGLGLRELHLRLRPRRGAGRGMGRDGRPAPRPGRGRGERSRGKQCSPVSPQCK